MGIDDFQHVILDGIQGEQKSDFTIIVTFNGLGLFPRRLSTWYFFSLCFKSLSISKEFSNSKNWIWKPIKRHNLIAIYANEHNLGCPTLQSIQSKVTARIKFGFMFIENVEHFEDLIGIRIALFCLNETGWSVLCLDGLWPGHTASIHCYEISNGSRLVCFQWRWSSSTIDRSNNSTAIQWRFARIWCHSCWPSSRECGNSMVGEKI